MSSSTENIPAKDVATLVRRALRRDFPEVKFSVRTSTHANGASVQVSWVDGPAHGRVHAVVSQYAGGGFDGMIDLTYWKTHYLWPDGSVLLHHCSGTVGSGGTVPSQSNAELAHIMPKGVKVVRLGADYVLAYREISQWEALNEEATEWLYSNVEIPNRTGNPKRDRLGDRLVGVRASDMVQFWEEGKDWGSCYRDALCRVEASPGSP